MTGKDVGMMIALRRKELGLTQKQLAEKVGRDTRTISDYENGGVDIRLSSLIAVAEALETTLPGLLNGTKRKPQKQGIEVRIYQLEDRMNAAQIFVKNGYTVSQVKRSKEGQKNVEYRLRLEEAEENIRIVR